MAKSSSLAIALCAVLLAACAPAQATSQPPNGSNGATAADVADLTLGPERQKTLEDGARREGQLVMYTTSTGLDPVMQTFMKKYPFIKASLAVARGETLVQRTLNEAKAGRLGADVLRIDYSFYDDIKDLMVRFNSPGARFDVPTMAPTGYGGIVFIYSSARVAQPDVPHRVEDLLSPRWKGDLGLHAPPNNFAGRWVGTLIDQMGEQPAKDFLAKLGDQRPAFFNEGQAAKNNVLSGEWDLSSQSLTSALISQHKHDPLGWMPLDPTDVTPQIIGLTHQAPHPFAAMLFLDWVFTPEGLKTLADVAGELTPDELQAREKDGVRLPQRLHVESPADGPKVAGWMKLFEQLVMKKS